MKAIVIIAVFAAISFTATAQLCPDSLKAVCKTKEPARGDTLIFQVTYKNGLGAIPTYNWTVSEGSILSGQGTSTIKVETVGISGDYLTATIELGGYTSKCQNVTSESAYVMKEHIIYEAPKPASPPTKKKQKKQ